MAQQRPTSTTTAKVPAAKTTGLAAKFEAAFTPGAVERDGFSAGRKVG
jgi:hypothetical protein